MLCIIVAQAAAQPSGLPGNDASRLRRYQQDTLLVVTNARRLVEPTLTSAELQIARDIDYRVYATESVGAFAAYEDKRRVVLIQVGATVWSMELATAFIAEEQLGITGCTMDYLTYVAKGIVDNSRRYANRLPLRPVAYFARYADTSSGPCSSFEPTKFTSRPDLDQYRASLVEASIAFLYLHELGHHILGHAAGLALSPDGALPGGSDDHLAMRRDQEDAADRWAIRTALRAHTNPAVGIPIFLLIAAIGGDSNEAERRMDHPLGMRRVATMYDEVYGYYAQHRNELPSPGYLDDLRHRSAVAHAAVESAEAK